MDQNRRSLHRRLAIVDEHRAGGVSHDVDLEELEMMASAALPCLARWARLYADHKAVSVGFTYLHLAGVLVGGGFAVAADRATLRLSPERGPEWSRDLGSLTTVHRWVIAGLCLTFVSGVFMMLADLDTYMTWIVF